jgi:hypothetical protein
MKRRMKDNQSWDLMHSTVDIFSFCLSYIMMMADMVMSFSFVIFFGRRLGKVWWSAIAIVALVTINKPPVVYFTIQPHILVISHPQPPHPSPHPAKPPHPSPYHTKTLSQPHPCPQL